MCLWVCVSLFQCGGLGNYLFGIPGQSFTARPRGSDWKRAGYWLSDPPTSSPLLFTHPSLLLHPFFFPHRSLLPSILHFYWLTFTDIVAIFSASLGPPNPFLSNLQLMQNAATEAKNTQNHTSLIILLRKQEPNWDHSLSLLDMSSFALPKTTLKACSNLFFDMEAPLNWPAWGAEGC